MAQFPDSTQMRAGAGARARVGLRALGVKLLGVKALGVIALGWIPLALSGWSNAGASQPAKVDSDGINSRNLTFATPEQQPLPTIDWPLSTVDAVPETRQAAPSASQLDLDISFERSNFRVNEDFSFTVQGNHDFYLYVFYLDKASHQAVMVLPNAAHASNFFPAKKPQRVPEAGSFYADQAGSEELLIVASREHFDWQTEGYSRLDGMLATDLVQFDRQVRALRYRPPAVNSVSLSRDNPALVVKRVRLQVQANAQ